MISTVAFPAAETIDLTVVVPCKNEEANVIGTLDTVVSAVQEIGCSYEILVMDDGSTDKTSALVENYQREHPNLPVRLHRNPENLGLSRTYVDGAFLARGKYYRLVFGDNVESKDAMISILRHMGEADIIIPYHEEVAGKSRVRILVSHLFTALVNLFSSNSIRYYNGGAIHLRYNVLRWHPYSFGFGFQADFITRLIQEGATFVEVCAPATHTQKDESGSPFTFRNIVSTGHTLSEILRRRINVLLFGR